MRSAENILLDLAGAIWRLEKYGYIRPTEFADEYEEAKRDHWLWIMHNAIKEAQEMARGEL